MDRRSLNTVVEGKGLKPIGLARVNPVRPKRELLLPRLALPESLRSGELSLAGLYAPAGYGKSTVMANWRDTLEADGCACCWLSLREQHRDPKTLFQGLLGALQQQIPELVIESTERNLRSATSYLIEPLLTSLVDELVASQQRIVLFLDELENLAESPGKKALMLLIELRPENLSIVLSGRRASHSGMSKYRLAGQIFELRTSDLSFTVDEIKSLLVDNFGIAMADEAIASLASKTEGWPAALSLFALGAVVRQDAGGSLDDFTSPTGELADYLGELLLEGLDESTQDLMMRAVVPDHFSLDLLQQLVPDQDPVQALETIRQSSLFLQSLDSQGREYRVHSLCADFLRRRLRQTKPQLYNELLKTTGDWCWANNQPYEAVQYAKLAQDWPQMADRIADVAEAVVRAGGEFNTYLNWLRDLPQAVLKTRPQLFLYQAWALGFSRDVPQAEIALHRLESLLPSLPEDQAYDYRRQLEMHRFPLEAIMDRAHLILDDMQGWLQRYPDAPEMEQGLVYGSIPSAARNANQLMLALSALANAEKIYRKMGSDYSLSWVHNIRLSVLIKSGNYVDARVQGGDGLKAICETLGDQSSPAGMSNAMLAYLAYEKGDIAAASDFLDKSMRYIARQGVVDPLYFAHLTQSWLAADDGNDLLSQTILLEGEQLGITYQLPRLTIQLATRRALQLLHQGDRDAAEAVMQSRQLLEYPVDEFVDAREQCAALLRVNMELLQGRFGDAAMRAKSLSKDAAAAGCFRMKAEYDFIRVIALQNAGELNEAGRRFHELLSQMAVQERHRFMLHYGSLGRRLIAEQYKLRQHAPESGGKVNSATRVLNKLAAALGLLEKSTEATAETSFVEGLTKREIDILTRAARTGLNNKKLAESLFVSEGTLKWHLHNIYSKLEVRNRAGAIAQAQRLGLLS